MFFFVPFLHRCHSFDATVSASVVVILNELADQFVDLCKRIIFKAVEKLPFQNTMISFHMPIFLWCGYMRKLLF